MPALAPLGIFPVVSPPDVCAGLDPNVAHVIVKAGGIAPLVRRSAKGSTDVRVAALTVLRDIAKAGHSLIESGMALDQMSLAPIQNILQSQACPSMCLQVVVCQSKD